VIIAIKHLGDPGRQALVDTVVVLNRRERMLTFLYFFLCQALLCTNHYLRAHMNRSVEEGNGTNIASQYISCTQVAITLSG